MKCRRKFSSAVNQIISWRRIIGESSSRAVKPFLEWHVGKEGNSLMTVRSSNEASDTHQAKNLVALDKDGRIQVLDADVLDLIAGGVAPSRGLLDNGNCNCSRQF
jgi:hypothetical protein